MACRAVLAVAIPAWALLGGCARPVIEARPVAPGGMGERPKRILLEAGDGAGPSAMRVVNDDVMGGKSTSSVAVTPDGTFLFAGTISLKNFGGFATCRTRPGRFDLRGATGVCLRVRGDGKRYALFLKNNEADDGRFYEAAFHAPAGLWSTVYVPLTKLTARFQGMLDLLARPLNAGDVRVMGLLIAYDQAGPFRLELAWIGTYDEAPPAR